MSEQTPHQKAWETRRNNAEKAKNEAAKKSKAFSKRAKRANESRGEEGRKAAGQKAAATKRKNARRRDLLEEIEVSRKDMCNHVVSVLRKNDGFRDSILSYSGYEALTPRKFVNRNPIFAMAYFVGWVLADLDREYKELDSVFVPGLASFTTEERFRFFEEADLVINPYAAGAPCGTMADFRITESNNEEDLMVAGATREGLKRLNKLKRSVAAKVANQTRVLT